MIQIFAFVFGVAAVSFTFLISRIYKRDITLVLVLGGIIVGALFSAFTSLIKYLADPYDRLPTIVFWLMGSFAKITMTEVYYVAPVILVCTAIILLVRWEAERALPGRGRGKIARAQYQGLCEHHSTLRYADHGRVGLHQWHYRLGRSSHPPHRPHDRGAGPCPAAPGHHPDLGHPTCLAVDVIARNLTMYEIPIGIITSIVGAPFFIYLLGKNRAGWS